jgi:hypothetical protein
LGARLAAIASISLDGGVSGGAWLCNVTGSDYGYVNCSLPAGLPAGVYTVRAAQADGAPAVTLGAVGADIVYTAAPRVGALLGNVGSIVGGAELIIRAPPGADGGFNTTHAAANDVFVGGQRCDVVSGSVTDGELACRATGVAGLVRAEYWRLDMQTSILPDLRSYRPPGGRPGCASKSTCQGGRREPSCKVGAAEAA